jgi:hypothetical protein
VEVATAEFTGRHAVTITGELHETPIGRLLEELWFVEGRAYNLTCRSRHSGTPAFEQWYRWLQEIRIGLEARLKEEQGKLLQVEFGNRRLLAAVFPGEDLE